MLHYRENKIANLKIYVIFFKFIIDVHKLLIFYNRYFRFLVSICDWTTYIYYQTWFSNLGKKLLILKSKNNHIINF